MLDTYEISGAAYTFLNTFLLLISRNSNCTHTVLHRYMHKPLLSQTNNPPILLDVRVPLLALMFLQLYGYPCHPLPPSGPHASEKAPHRLTYTAPGVGPYWLHCAMTLLAGCRLLMAPSRNWDASRVTSVSAKIPDFGSSCFQSKVSSLLSQIFMLLFYFFSCCFFVSKRSLKFPDYSLIWVMITFPFNIISFGHLLSR